jgi:hypothetical protein
LRLFYADASALVKFGRADLVSSELVLAEVPRAIRRAASHDPHLPLELLITRAGELLDALALMPLDRPLLDAVRRVRRACLSPSSRLSRR